MNELRDRWNKRSIFLLLWPLVIEQILNVSIGLVDTIMVASVGEHAISGVALVDAIATLFIFAFGALSTGGSVVVSQYLGRNDTKNASAAAKQLIYVCSILSFAMMLLALIFRNILLRKIYGNIGPDVMAAAQTYFFFSALSYPALALYNAAAALFRSMGNSRITMKISLLKNIIHVILNLAFIYGLRLGVAGVALSTLVTRIFGAALLLYLLIKGKKRLITINDLNIIKFEPAIIWSILRIGIPSGIEHSLFQFGKIAVSRIATNFGTAAIAANSVTGSVNSLVLMPGNAISMVMLVIISQCVGAGDYTNAKYYVKKFLILTHIVMFAAAAINYIFVNQLVGLYKLGPEAHALTVSFLRFLCFMIVIAWPTSFSLPSALRAAGDAKYIMVVAIISMWIIRVFGAYVFSMKWGAGPIGIWYAWTLDWVLRSVCFIHRWRSGKWQENRILPTA